MNSRVRIKRTYYTRRVCNNLGLSSLRLKILMLFRFWFSSILFSFIVVQLIIYFSVRVTLKSEFNKDLYIHTIDHNRCPSFIYKHMTNWLMTSFSKSLESVKSPVKDQKLLQLVNGRKKKKITRISTKYLHIYIQVLVVSLITHH